MIPYWKISAWRQKPIDLKAQVERKITPEQQLRADNYAYPKHMNLNEDRVISNSICEDELNNYMKRFDVNNSLIARIKYKLALWLLK